MKKVNLVQGSLEWLEFRKTRIGASEAPIILGISPYMTPLQLWKEKTGREEGQRDSIAMEFGRRKEDQIRQYWEQKKGEFYPPTTVFCEEYDFAMASLDGLSSNENLILECKCVNEEAWNISSKNKVVDHHYAQAQHQLMVTGCKCVQFVYFHRSQYRSIEVFPDPEYIKDMLQKEVEFFELMISDEEPPMSEKDFVDMSEDAEWTALEIQAKYLYQKLKECERQWKEMQDKFKTISGERNTKGDVIRVTVVTRKGIICTKNIQKDGIDLEKYRKEPTTSLRMTINVKGSTETQDNEG